MNLTPFSTNGFQVLEDVYSAMEIRELLAELARYRLEEAFGLREVLVKYPTLQSLVFTDRLKTVVQAVDPQCRLMIKSIYFDKPPHANWVVNWHQDLTINVQNKTATSGFTKWRVLPDRTVVRPPIPFLEQVFTIRIHLDDCTAESGALRVIPGSHLDGVQGKPTAEQLEQVQVCPVPQGGVMLMRPLLLHASRRTVNAARRRVLHLEFSGVDLPEGLEWKEIVSY